MIRYFCQLFCRLLFYEHAGLTVHCLVFILSFLSFLSFHGTFVKAVLAAFCYCACLPSIIKRSFSMLKRKSRIPVFPFIYDTLHTEIADIDNLRKKILTSMLWNLHYTSNRPWELNLLALELFFLILAHSVYKMWIIQGPNKLELWNKLHFKEKKQRVYTTFKIFGTYICWINI